jgi:hypothetical protein
MKAREAAVLGMMISLLVLSHWKHSLKREEHRTIGENLDTGLWLPDKVTRDFAA